MVEYYQIEIFQTPRFIVAYAILVGWTEGLLFQSFQILRKNGEARIYLKERNKQQEVRNLESDKKMPITYRLKRLFSVKTQ